MNRRDALKRTALIMGAAVSASTVAAVLDGCTPSGGGMEWTPQFLDKPQAGIVNAFAERLLPRTDTPGAQDVGVPEYIDRMYGQYLTEKETETFTAGLAEVEALSQAAHQSSFVSLDAAKQDELIMSIATEEGKPKAFLRKMRELTILGFVTTEVISKEMLAYDPIPGAYKGCIDLAENGSVNWAQMR